jgi:YD repeat-containing protein
LFRFHKQVVSFWLCCLALVAGESNQKTAPDTKTIFTFPLTALQEQSMLERVSVRPFRLAAISTLNYAVPLFVQVYEGYGAMKQFCLFLLLGVAVGSANAADTNKTASPGREDLRRYVAAEAKPGKQTTLRDASGRTLGTASTAGIRTTFRDQAGRTTGVASIEGNRTVFRDASGRTIGTATTSGQQTTYRDAAGRTQAISAAAGGRTTFRNSAGRTTTTVQSAGATTTARDASGRTVGTSSAGPRSRAR